MDINKKLVVIGAVLLAMCVGVAFYYYHDTEAVVPIEENTPITYSNTQYGFMFSLPENWRGYSIVETIWEGTPLTSNIVQNGPKLLIRNPEWTVSEPYEDLPILIFTTEQWDDYRAEKFAVSAAPIQASELGRNNTFVFALPPRWNFDYSLGYEEAEDIIASNPLQTFEVVGESTESYECQADAMICPDGSAVGRQGTKCEFAACPEVTATSTLVTAYLGGTVTGLGVSVSPQVVVSDSRCPAEVTCIWAGTVEVQVMLETPDIYGEYVMTLGKPQKFCDYSVTLIDVSPTKTEEAIPESSYRFTFEIEKD